MATAKVEGMIHANGVDISVVTIEQLLVLTNLENINALLIKQGLPQQERLQKLRDTVVYQIRTLSESKGAKELNYIHNHPKLAIDE